MILGIDYSDKLTLAFYSKNREIVKSFEIQRRSILGSVAGFLAQNRVKLDEIQKFAVNRGPGSYTSLRSGLTIANTLAWLLDRPIYGYPNITALKAAKKAAKEKSSSHFKKPVFPKYSK